MKLDQPISHEQIQQFRGIVDFYSWKGIPVARSWPRPPVQPGTPAQRATWNNLKHALAWKQQNPLQWHELMQTIPLTIGHTVETVKRSIGMSLAKQDQLTTPPVYASIEVEGDEFSTFKAISLTFSNFVDLDTDKLVWKIQPIKPDSVRLDWYSRYVSCSRSGKMKRKNFPYFPDYEFPEATTWVPGSEKVVLETYSVQEDFWILPFVSDPLCQTFPLGAPVRKLMF